VSNEVKQSFWHKLLPSRRARFLLWLIALIGDYLQYQQSRHILLFWVLFGALIIVVVIDAVTFGLGWYRRWKQRRVVERLYLDQQQRIKILNYLVLYFRLTGCRRKALGAPKQA